jgi:hypothetical protein
VCEGLLEGKCMENHYCFTLIKEDPVQFSKENRREWERVDTHIAARSGKPHQRNTTALLLHEMHRVER